MQCQPENMDEGKLESNSIHKVNMTLSEEASQDMEGQRTTPPTPVTRDSVTPSRKRALQLESPSDSDSEMLCWKRRSKSKVVVAETERSTSIATSTEGKSSIKIVKKLDREHQEVLLLHGAKQRYAHTTQQAIPRPQNDREMLVQVQVIGLNPIDWKAPDFGWGLPTLPCIAGRDLAGEVIEGPREKSRIKPGDLVMGISTDYRDSRKAAYQEFSIVADYNACRLPTGLSLTAAAPLGVAFVAAALALGVCLGVDFSAADNGTQGPDLLQIIRLLPRESLPEDIRGECFDGISDKERPRPCDWIAIWGGATATGICATQLAKLAGLKVICILDVAKSGKRMLRHGADLLVDRLDTARAAAVVHAVTEGKLRFGIDAIGKDTAGLLAGAMQAGGPTTSHLVGLTGLPKPRPEGIVCHTVPIKSFHEAPAIGESLMVWLEKLLAKGLLSTPEIEVADGGLKGINDALDRLRDGSVNGPRIVVPLSKGYI